MSFHPQVRLLAATEPLLNALNDSRALFGELIGSSVPDGWPEFPEAIGFTLEYLQTTSEADRSWSMQSLLTRRPDGSSALVASRLRLQGAPSRSATRSPRSFGVGVLARPLPGHWSTALSPVARSIKSLLAHCQARIRRRVCSCRSASSTPTTKRSPGLASSGSGDGPDR